MFFESSKPKKYDKMNEGKITREKNAAPCNRVKWNVFRTQFAIIVFPSMIKHQLLFHFTKFRPKKKHRNYLFQSRKKLFSNHSFLSVLRAPCHDNTYPNITTFLNIVYAFSSRKPFVYLYLYHTNYMTMAGLKYVTA